MKKILVALCLILALTACKKLTAQDINPFAEIQTHTAQYMDWQDAEKVALALQKSADRQCVKWENPDTGYQYSAFVFKSSKQGRKKVREITLLTTSPQSQGETLELVGTSEGKGVWLVYAIKPATPVGTVKREALAAGMTPPGRKRDFPGYPIITGE